MWFIYLLVLVCLAGLGILLYFTLTATSSTTTPTPGGTIGDEGTLSVSFQDGRTDIRTRSQPSRTYDVSKLEYYLSRLTLAEDIEFSGTAYNNPTNALEIFQNENDDYDSYGFTEAKEDTENYVDLLDAAALEQQLVFQVPLETTYTINYVLLNWFRPYKIQATVTGSQGSLMYTDGDGIVNASENLVSEDANYLQEPAELATVVQNNGGSWQRLAQPVVMQSGETWRLLLTFDPRELTRGIEEPLTPTDYDTLFGLMIDKNGRYFQTPIMPILPVLYQAGEQVWMETYHLNWGSNLNYRARLQLVMRGAEGNTLASANIAIVPLAEAVTGLQSDDPWAPQIFFVEEDAESSFVFWALEQQYKIVSEFIRSATAGTCQINLDNSTAVEAIVVQSARVKLV